MLIEKLENNDILVVRDRQTKNLPSPEDYLPVIAGFAQDGIGRFRCIAFLDCVLVLGELREMFKKYEDFLGISLEQEKRGWLSNRGRPVKVVIAEFIIDPNHTQDWKE